MTISESANQLISHAADYLNAGVGITNTAGESLTAASGMMSSILTLSNNSAGTVSSILGSGHQSTAPLAGLAGYVGSKADAAQAAIEQAQIALNEVDKAMTLYSNTIGVVGNQLLRGSS